MGEAKRRGTREQRKAQAVERNRIEWERREAERHRNLARIRDMEPSKKLALLQEEEERRARVRRYAALAGPLALFSGLALTTSPRSKRQ